MAAVATRAVSGSLELQMTVVSVLRSQAVAGCRVGGYALSMTINAVWFAKVNSDSVVSTQIDLP